MKQKILFLQPTFDTHGPRNIRTTNIVKYLKKNYDVYILCLETYEKYRQIEDLSILRVQQTFLGKYIFNKIVSHVKLNKTLLYFSRITCFLFGKLYFPDTFKVEHKNLITRVKNITEIDIIIASIVPFSNADLAYLLKEKFYKGAKVVLDIGDPFVKNSAAKNTDSKKMIKYEKLITEKADHIIVTNELTKQHYLNYNNLPKNISIIPQGVNIDEFVNKSRVKKVKRKNTPTVMIYAGAFYPKLRDPKAFVNAVNIVDPKNLEINLYGITNEIGFRCTNTNIKQYKRVSQHSLSLAFSKADVLLYFDNAFGMQTSGKIYELLALKKPILFIYSNKKSPIFTLAKIYEHIHFVKNNLESLKTLFHNIDNFSYNYSYDYCIKEFSWENRAVMFKKALELAMNSSDFKKNANDTTIIN